MIDAKMFMTEEAYGAMKARYARFNEMWTPGEKEELAAMARDGVPRREMAEHLHRTPQAIRMKLKALGLTGPPSGQRAWGLQEEARLVEMYRAGVDFKTMAGILHRSEDAVVRRLTRLRMNLFG